MFAPRLLTTLALIASLFLNPAAYSQSTVQTHTIPFRFDEVTPNLVVQAKINGGAPMSFLLDTGTAAALIVQPWVRDQLALKTLTPADASGTPETDAVDSFALVGKDGDVRFDVSQAYVADLGILDSVYGTHKIAGLIGVQLLSTTAAEFDFAAKTVTIYEGGAPTIAGASTMPLTVNSDGVATVSVTVAPGKSVDLPVDTGGMFTGLPVSMTPSLAPSAVITRHWSGQVSGMYMCPDFLLPSIDVGGSPPAPNNGGVEVKDAVVETLPDTARCTLGLNILTHFKMIMDIPHGQLTLAPRTDKFPEYGEGWSGIHFDPTSAVWRVKGVDAASPAKLAGVKPGDEIDKIDGYALDGLTNAMVFHLLEGDAGAPAKLSIKRNGKPVTVRFVRGDEFDAPRLPFDGLMLQKPDGAPMSVIGVQHGCAAYRAGVHVGDTIVSIDGQPTETMSVDQMHQAAIDTYVHLELKRPNVSTPVEVDLRPESTGPRRADKRKASAP